MDACMQMRLWLCPGWGSAGRGWGVPACTRVLRGDGGQRQALEPRTQAAARLMRARDYAVCARCDRGGAYDCCVRRHAA